MVEEDREDLLKRIDRFNLRQTMIGNDFKIKYIRSSEGAEYVILTSCNTSLVKLPNYVTHISNNVLAGGKVETFIGGAGLKELEAGCFNNCKYLTHVDLSMCKKLRNIENAFEGCGNLRRVILPEGLENLSDCFKGCEKLEFTLPKSVKNVYRYGLQGTIENDIIDTEIIKIKGDRISGCNIKTLIIRKTENKTYFLKHCNIEKLIIEGDVPKIEVYGCQIGEVRLEESKLIRSNAFMSCKMNNFIAKELEIVDSSAFLDSKIDNINIGNKLIHIGATAFANTTIGMGYNMLHQPELRKIGRKAFSAAEIIDTSSRKRVEGISLVVSNKKMCYIEEEAFECLSCNTFSIDGNYTMYDKIWGSSRIQKLKLKGSYEIKTRHLIDDSYIEEIYLQGNMLSYSDNILGEDIASLRLVIAPKELHKHLSEYKIDLIEG